MHICLCAHMNESVCTVKKSAQVTSFVFSPIVINNLTSNAGALKCPHHKVQNLLFSCQAVYQLSLTPLGFIDIS